MKEYTFEEVIVNIKEGETYKCDESGYVVKTIYRSGGGFRFNNNEPMDFCGINNMQRFVKVEKLVTFEEARKEYRDNNKTIQSCVSERIFRNGVDTEIGFSEIEGRWIVLD